MTPDSHEIFIGWTSYVINTPNRQDREEPEDRVQDSPRRPTGRPELHRAGICRHAAQAHCHEVALTSGIGCGCCQVLNVIRWHAELKDCW